LNKNVKSESKIICPICGSSSVKKNGKDSYEKQRYFCNDCHRSFSENTKTLFFCSHFTKDQWLKFIDYEISGLTLKDEAYFIENKNIIFSLKYFPELSTIFSSIF
jgi:transposase-like protein